MRLIDADAFEQEIRRHIIKNDCGYFTTRQKAINDSILDCIDLLKKAPTSTIPVAELDTTEDFAEWIPCALMLPEEDDNTEVLVSVNERYAVYKIILLPSRSVKTEYKLGHIDAWMPLPEPYKEEGGEK